MKYKSVNKKAAKKNFTKEQKKKQQDNGTIK